MFTPEDTWHGGYFELSIEVGARSDDRLRLARDSLWEHPHLKGCYARRDTEPERQQLIAPSEFTFDDGWGGHYFGIATLPNRRQIASGACVVRETNGPDWLDFYLPLGALGTAYDVGAFPFLLADDPPATWIADVEPWLGDIALWLAKRIDFALALIGFEVSGHCYAADVARGGIPANRYIGYVWPTNGRYEYFGSNADIQAKSNDGNDKVASRALE
jgi:hypothetical protein